MPRTNIRWQAVRDLGLVDRAQRRVAFQAQGEGSRAAAQVEALEDLDGLLLGLERVHEAAVGELAALEQLAVAGENDAAFADGDGDDLGVVVMVVVEGVEARQTQQPGQAAEVGVGDEARDARRCVARAAAG